MDVVMEASGTQQGWPRRRRVCGVVVGCTESAATRAATAWCKARYDRSEDSKTVDRTINSVIPCRNVQFETFIPS